MTEEQIIALVRALLTPEIEKEVGYGERFEMGYETALDDVVEAVRAAFQEQETGAKPGGAG